MPLRFRAWIDRESTSVRLKLPPAKLVTLAMSVHDRLSTSNPFWRYISRCMQIVRSHGMDGYVSVRRNVNPLSGLFLHRKRISIYVQLKIRKNEYARFAQNKCH